MWTDAEVEISQAPTNIGNNDVGKGPERPILINYLKLLAWVKILTNSNQYGQLLPRRGEPLDDTIGQKILSL